MALTLSSLSGFEPTIKKIETPAPPPTEPKELVEDNPSRVARGLSITEVGEKQPPTSDRYEEVQRKIARITRDVTHAFPDWACPICMSRKYVVRIDRINTACVIGYACEGCSIVFSDPKKFNTGLKLRN